MQVYTRKVVRLAQCHRPYRYALFYGAIYKSFYTATTHNHTALVVFLSHRKQAKIRPIERNRLTLMTQMNNIITIMSPDVRQCTDVR